MTDEELIRALRQGGFFIDKTGVVHIDQLKDKAADRLEAMLLENERLKASVAQWYPARESVPKHDGIYLCCVKSWLSGGSPVLSLVMRDELGWYRFDFGRKIYTENVTHWRPLPEPPGTEGVE